MDIDAHSMTECYRNAHILAQVRLLEKKEGGRKGATPQGRFGCPMISTFAILPRGSDLSILFIVPLIKKIGKLA